MFSLLVPNAPLMIFASARSISVRFTRQPNDHGFTYFLDYATTGEAPRQKACDLSARECKAANLKPATRYNLRVQCCFSPPEEGGKILCSGFSSDTAARTTPAGKCYILFWWLTQCGNSLLYSVSWSYAMRESLLNCLFYWFCLLGLEAPRLIERSPRSLILRFEPLKDSRRNYTYHLSYKSPTSSSVSMLCDIDTLRCEVTGLQPRQAYTLSFTACFMPQLSSQLVCGNKSEELTEWTQPTGQWFANLISSSLTMI